MKGTTHVAFGGMLGLVTAVATYNTVGAGDPIIYGSTILVGSGLGALLPDIDAEGATITKKLGIAGTVVAKGLKHRGITHTLLGLFVFALATLGITNLFTAFYDGGLLGRFLVASIMTFIFSCMYKRVKALRVALRKVFKQNATITSIVSKLVVFITVMALSDYFIDFVNIFGLSLILGYLSHLISDSFNVSGCPWLFPFVKQNFSIGKCKTGKHDGIFLAGSFAVTLIALVIL